MVMYVVIISVTDGLDVVSLNDNRYQQGAIKYGRLAEFLPGNCNFQRKFKPILSPKSSHILTNLPNNRLE